MNLECLNNIISENLAINIDINNSESWDLNLDYTTISLNKWKNSHIGEVNLPDFGLTGFDFGRSINMWDGTNITSDKLKLYRIGYNNVTLPSSGSTSGITSNISYDGYDISPEITNNNEYYFDLNGGYLTGFFKLYDYDYELFPSRYNNGITIETLVNLNENSSGMFYYMGARSEDKYNPYFSGETITGTSSIIGVNTSEDNYLNAIIGDKVIKPSFRSVEDKYMTKWSEETPINNLKNNVIGFEITTDKKIGYKYIDGNGNIIYNHSDNTLSDTGWTVISITFTPNYIINENLIDCTKQRNGDLNFYINGRSIWKVKEFPEFYFSELSNNKEKQLGIPYSISWGGGSFGLKNSWHYEYNTYELFNNNSQTYINESFNIYENPINNDIDVELSGITLTEEKHKFYYIDDIHGNESECSVIDVNLSGYTGNCIFIKYENPINIISNRDYVFESRIYNSGIFNGFGENKISIIGYGTSNIEIIDSVEYQSPIINNDGVNGLNEWVDIKSTIRVPENLGSELLYIGILIESTNKLDGNLYIYDFKYTAPDILVKDVRKNNQIIEDNFNDSFIGGIQKLRIYDRALSSREVLHNAIIESKDKDIKVSKGGRIIWR